MTEREEIMQTINGLKDMKNNVGGGSHAILWGNRGNDWEMLIGPDRFGLPGFPAGRCMPGFAYDRLRRGVWMTNGQARYGKTSDVQILNGLFFLDLNNLAWRLVGPEPVQERQLESQNNTLLQVWVDRQGRVCTFYQRWGEQIIRFDPSWPELTNVPPLNDPDRPMLKKGWVSSPLAFTGDPRLTQQQVAHDIVGNRVITYDAQNGITWAIDLDTNSATALSQQRLPVVDRYSMCYHEALKTPILFGGFLTGESPDVMSPALNDTLIMINGEWRRCLLGNKPTPRQAGCIVYNSDTTEVTQISGQAWDGGGDGYGASSLLINPVTLITEAIT